MSPKKRKPKPMLAIAKSYRLQGVRKAEYVAIQRDYYGYDEADAVAVWAVALAEEKAKKAKRAK